MSLLVLFQPKTPSVWPKPLTMISGRRKVWVSGAVLELTASGRVRLVASSTRKVSIAENGRLTAPAV